MDSSESDPFAEESSSDDEITDMAMKIHPPYSGHKRWSGIDKDKRRDFDLRFPISGSNESLSAPETEDFGSSPRSRGLNSYIMRDMQQHKSQSTCSDDNNEFDGSDGPTREANQSKSGRGGGLIYAASAALNAFKGVAKRAKKKTKATAKAAKKAVGNVGNKGGTAVRKTKKAALSAVKGTTDVATLALKGTKDAASRARKQIAEMAVKGKDKTKGKVKGIRKAAERTTKGAATRAKDAASLAKASWQFGMDWARRGPRRGYANFRLQSTHKDGHFTSLCNL